MSTTTDKLALFKYDPSTDGAQTFNIQKALNDNWDRLDDAVKEILITLANKAAATHAERHAKDGADPITPESIGAAPGGFGLGEASIAFSDANDCVTNGWYCDVNGTAANTPFTWCHILVSTFMGNGMYVRQDAYITGESNVSTRHMVRFKHPNITDNNGWSVWEWEHGMYMSPGVEYRTTERYLGKPVYVKAVDCGAMANNKTIVITDDSKRILDVILKGNPTLFPMGPNGSGLGAWDGCFTAGGTQITLYAGDSLAASNHAAVAIAKLIDA